jgi:Ca2+-binding EF-hand superfamily protein
MKGKLALLVISAGFVGIAFAGGMKHLDTDKDGTIDRTEAAADEVLIEVFEQVDANQDGVIESVEFSAYEASLEGAPAEETEKEE